MGALAPFLFMNNMKKQLIFIFIVLFNIVYSQDKILVEYTTKLDGEVFKSTLLHDSIKRISIFKNYIKEIKPGTAYINSEEKVVGEMIDFVEEFYKNLNVNEVFSYCGIKYIPKEIVKENINFDWKINYENKKSILGYNCYEAKIKFKSRNYIVYFADKIKISDGPRKFFGLPGLILEVKEETGKIQIIANSIHHNNENVETTLNIGNNKRWEELLEKAKIIYFQKKSEIEKKYNGYVHIDFSNNLEVYDLNSQE